MKHWESVLPKLEIFWQICILSEILGRWCTGKCFIPVRSPDVDGICFCRGKRDENAILYNNIECPYVEFQPSCLALDSVKIPKTWFCPPCSRLSQFKRRKNARQFAKSTTTNHAAMVCDSICICHAKPNSADKLLECRSANCKSEKFFHLSCLGYQRMPNNSKTWKCAARKKGHQSAPESTICASPTESSITIPSRSAVSRNVSIIESDDVLFVKEARAEVDKQGALAYLEESDYQIILDPFGWINCDIIHRAQVLLHEANPFIEGFQRPTLGRIRNFNVVSSEFIQLLLTGNDHWVCISSIGCLAGHVNLYDSFYHDIISQEVEEQTNDLLGGSLVALNVVPVQQQTNGSDCGVFAIAFATCLTLERDPSQISFDIHGMRPHLASCLRNGALSLFPCF